MNTLSVVISAFNGEKYLEDCLSSIAEIADEIIVIDHQSTDKTAEIAKKFTKKVFQQKNNPQEIDIQKNYGFEKATKEWVLSLDADESVSPDLASEIKEVLVKNQKSNIQNPIAGYEIPRKNIIFGEWIEHTGWYPDYQLRLFVRGKGKFTKRHVHESIQIDGPTKKLVSPILHQAYQSIYQFLHRGLTVYAPNEAESIHANSYTFSYADAIRFPFQEFLSRFFAREGYKDGFHGLLLSLLMAFYHFAIFLYLWEYEKFPTDINAEKLLMQELRKTHTEWAYWTTSIKIDQTKNSTKKLFLKTKRKLGL